MPNPSQTSSKPPKTALPHLPPYHFLALFRTWPNPTFPKQEAPILRTYKHFQKRYHSLRHLQKYTSKLRFFPHTDLYIKSCRSLNGLQKLILNIKPTQRLLFCLAKTVYNNPTITTVSLKICQAEPLKPFPFEKLTKSFRKIPKLKHLSINLIETKDSLVETFAKHLKGLKTLETFEIRASWQMYSSPHNHIPNQYPPLSKMIHSLSHFQQLNSLVIAFNWCPRITSSSIQDLVIGLKCLGNLRELEISFDYCWLHGVEQKPSAFDFMCICAAIGDISELKKLALKFRTWKIDDFQFDFLTERVERLKSLVEVDLMFGTNDPDQISHECLKRQMKMFSRMKELKCVKLDYWVEHKKRERLLNLLKILRPEQRKDVEIAWKREGKGVGKEKNACCSLF